MPFRPFILILAAACLTVSSWAQADISRWDNGETIPGTEGIKPGPGVDLSQRELAYANFAVGNLTDARFDFSNLSHANMPVSTLTNVNLTGANLSSAIMPLSVLTNANLTDANLSDANLERATLTNADLTGAVVAGANFGLSHGFGLSQAQLYSTKSYQDKNLAGIGLWDNYLLGWDFSGQDLSDANLAFSTLTNVNLEGAVVTGFDFSRTVEHGFTKEQLYSTQSYQEKNLSGIRSWENDLTGWDFSGQNLINADLYLSSLADADLSFVDLRGATGVSASRARLRNSILSDGRVHGLTLGAGEQMVIRDDDGVPNPAPVDWLMPRPPIEVAVQDRLTMADDGRLALQFDADSWDSQISFEQGILVQLGGTLELAFSEDVDLVAQAGRTLQLFDWTGVSPEGQFAYQVPAGTQWNLSNLYSAGEATLTAVHAPGDVDGNGAVDLADFNVLKTNFGDGGVLTDGDLTGDSQVDLADFVVLKANFGVAAVPEPGSVLLAAIACCVALARRRRFAARPRRVSPSGR